MNVVLWIVAALLASVFLMAGTMKILQPRAKLAALSEGMAFVEDFSDSAIIAIGVAEILAALGLVLAPAVRVPGIGSVGILAPIAAIGIVGLMFGAAVVHERRHEYAMIRVDLVLFALAFVVIWGRLGPYHFGT